MEIKFGGEAQKVRRIKHLRPDFHKIIKELLTCRSLQSHRLTPQPVFAPGQQHWPSHALEVAMGVAFHPSLTSHLQDSQHLIAGSLPPPLLHFPKVTPLKEVRSHLPFTQIDSKPSHFLRVKAGFLLWPRRPEPLLLESVGWDHQWQRHPLGAC